MFLWTPHRLWMMKCLRQRKSGWLIAVFMSAVRIAARCLVKTITSPIWICIMTKSEPTPSRKRRRTVRISTSLPHGGIWPRSMSGCGIMYSIPMRKSLPIRTCIRWQVTLTSAATLTALLRCLTVTMLCSKLRPQVSLIERHGQTTPFLFLTRFSFATIWLSWVCGRQLSYVWLTAIHSMFAIWFVTLMRNTRS